MTSNSSTTTGAGSSSGIVHAAAESSHEATTSEPVHAVTDLDTTNEWSPLDDGIEVQLPERSDEDPPSKEEVDAYISSVIFGPTPKRRLPVFEALWRGKHRHY